MDGAFQAKWYDEAQEEFFSSFCELVPQRPSVKVLLFRLPRPCKWKLMWQLHSLAQMLDRSEDGMYKSGSPAAIRQWLKWGLHKSWANSLSVFGAGNDHILHPAFHPSKVGSPLATQGYLMTTFAVILLIFHWVGHLAGDLAKRSAMVILRAIMETKMPAQFDLELLLHVRHESLPPAARHPVRLRVADGQIDLQELVDDPSWRLLERKHRAATVPRQADTQCLLVEWMLFMSGRRNARWLYSQCVRGIASILEAVWEPSGDLMESLRGNVADFGHRCDPSLRRAVSLAARAKLGGSRLHKAALALGRKRLGPNRNHLHCEMAGYFSELRRCFWGCQQLCIAPDDSRFHGKGYCLSPIMDLRTGMTGWLPPKARCPNFGPNVSVLVHRTFPGKVHRTFF